MRRTITLTILKLSALKLSALKLSALKLSAVAVMALAASCAGSRRHGIESEEITIAYDPACEDVGDALSQAQTHCAAFSATAVFVDETIDPDGRLRHRRFQCR